MKWGLLDQLAEAYVVQYTQFSGASLKVDENVDRIFNYFQADTRKLCILHAINSEMILFTLLFSVGKYYNI